jgi:membrane protease YdiL (CAAX protease family)
VGFLATVVLSFSMNLNYGGAMGEELGWRGLCLPLLLKTHTPLAASLILGFIWALWHVPLDLASVEVPGVFAVIFRMLWAFPLTIIFTWVYLKSPANLLTAMLMHASVNMLPDLGFSHYQSSIVMLALLLIAWAVFVGRTPMMRAGPPV